MTTSSSSSSQLGFRGTEDLGGGMKAAFWLEAGLSNDSGAGSATNTNNQASGQPASPGLGGGQGLTFNRRSTASIAGNFGEVRVGREYNTAFWNLTGFDPFATNGIGASASMSAVGVANTGGNYVRVSNGITYLYNHGVNATSVSGGQGFHAMLQTSMGENVSGTATSKDGNANGVRVGYNAGPLRVALGTAKTSMSTGDITSTNLGADYDLSVVKLVGQIFNNKVAAATAAKDKGYLLGAVAPVGTGTLKATYSELKRDDAASQAKADKFAVGYVYPFSKRTSVYATYATVSNKNGAAVALGGATGVADKKTTGYDIGLTHAF